MAARSGVLVPGALAPAATGERTVPSVSRASRAASTVMAARRTVPARSHRIEMLLLEMLVFTACLLAVALSATASVVAMGLVASTIGHRVGRVVGPRATLARRPPGGRGRR